MVRRPLLRLALLALVLQPLAGLPESGIEGRWATFEGTARRSVIEIRAQGEDLVGRIVEFFPQPGEDADPRCTACPGADRGRPIVGLAIVHLRREANAASWRGTVLDPDDGRTYRAVAQLGDAGRKLELRGYVGLPIFGRSETWTRMP